MTKIGKYIIVLFIIGLVSYILWRFSHIVAYILIAYVLSLIGHPLVEVLGKIKIKNVQIPKPIRALLTLATIWFFIFLFFRIFIPIVASQANELSQLEVDTISTSLEEPINELEQFVSKMNPGQKNDFTLETYFNEKITSFFDASIISNFFGFIANLLGNIFLAFIAISFITFFFLKDERLFADSLVLLFPSHHEQKVRKILASIKYLLSRYFIGICCQITCLIILVTTGLSIVGISFHKSLVIGLMVGIINVVPYLGPILGGLFGLFIGIISNLQMDFSSELLPLLIYMTLIFVIVQIIDNVLFQPLIFSSSVKAHPLEIFLVILLAASLAGVLGMILAVPTYTIIRVIAKEFFSQFKIVQKITEKI